MGLSNPEETIIQILRHLGEDPEREGLKDTPRRVVKSWKELYAGYGVDPASILTVFKDVHGYDQIVICKNIEMYSTCITGDSQIMMPGKNATIKELVGQTPFVYSWDETTSQFTIKKAFNIRKTANNVPVFRVFFDDGTFITTTSNHKFLLNDGKWKRLDELQQLDSLVSLRRQWQGGNILVNKTCRSGYMDSWQKEANFVWECFHPLKLVTRGYSIHHLDRNHYNNEPLNLEYLSTIEHSRLTASTSMKRKSFEERQIIGRKARAGKEDLKITNPGQYQENVQKQTEGLKRFYQSQEGIELRNKKSKMTKEQWRKKFKGSLNHKVLFIEPVGFQNVYNMEVNDNHNYVANGVVVHNCEHHLLSFFGKAHVAYLPDKRVIGISKLARLVDIYARRLQIQERIGEQVTTALMEYLQPKAAACIIQATHMCMCMRGVNKQSSTMITSSVKGEFLTDSAMRSELMELLKLNSNV